MQQRCRLTVYPQSLSTRAYTTATVLATRRIASTFPPRPGDDIRREVSIPRHYRSANASFNPSAANAPANPRRNHVITRGLEITYRRAAAANAP